MMTRLTMMTQTEYYTTLLAFILNLAGVAISIGLGCALVWYWWNFGRFFR